MKSQISLLLSLFLLTSCGSLTKKSTENFQLRGYESLVLKNGLNLVLLSDSSLPHISLNLMVKTGSLDEEYGKEGLNFLTAALLEEGTTTKNATQFADEIGQIASDLSIQPNDDYTIISADTISSQKNKLLELFADAMLNPAFSQTEVDRKKSNLIASIKKNMDNASSYADYLAEKTFFKNHPYSNLAMGNIDSLAKLNRTDIIKHYFKFYRPNNSVLIVSGDFEENYINDLKKYFENWISSDIGNRSVIEIARASSVPVLYTKPDLKQTEIRWLAPAMKRSDKDYLTVRLANMVLGGSFASRLNQHVRDDLGLTYSIHSSLDSKLDLGTLKISTFTRNEKANETIVESIKSLKNFYDNGINQKDLDAVKTLLKAQFPMAIETTDKLAFNLLVLKAYGLSDDYLRNFNKNVDKISLNEVNSAIKKYFKPEDFNLIIYGDESKLKNILKIDHLKIEKVDNLL